MSNIIKLAHDQGMHQALVDFGLVKEASGKNTILSNFSRILGVSSEAEQARNAYNKLSRKNKHLFNMTFQGGGEEAAHAVRQLRDGKVAPTDWIRPAPPPAPVASPVASPVAAPPQKARKPKTQAAQAAAPQAAAPQAAAPQAAAPQAAAPQAAAPQAAAAQGQAQQAQGKSKKVVKKQPAQGQKGQKGQKGQQGQGFYDEAMGWAKNNPGYAALGAAGLGAGGTYLASRPDDSFSGRMKFLLGGN